MIIKATQYVDMPTFPNVLAFISQPDHDGNRIRYINIAAKATAKIIRFLDPERKRCGISGSNNR